MSETFISAQRKWFPHAKLCLNGFHVVKEEATAFNWARVCVANKKGVDAEGNETKRDKFTTEEKHRRKRVRYDLNTKRWDLEGADFAYATELAERRARVLEYMGDVGNDDLNQLLPKPRASKCAKVNAILE